MQDPDPRWQKLVAAARQAPPDGPPPRRPPSGFASRIVALREAVAAFARTLLWRRWSVAVALACGVLLLAVFAVTRCGARPRPLIDPPPSVHPQP